MHVNLDSTLCMLTSMGEKNDTSLGCIGSTCKLQTLQAGKYAIGWLSTLLYIGRKVNAIGFICEGCLRARLVQISLGVACVPRL